MYDLGLYQNFAPVVPLHIARELQEADALGDYQLLLAHDVLEHPHEYKEVYGVADAVNRKTFIMDNSLIELGHPLPLDVTMEAAKAMGASFAVLPDYLGDKEQTLEACREALAHSKAAKSWTQDIGFIGVLQGQSTAELLECAEQMQLMHPNITAFSIPRVVTSLIGSRIEITQLIRARYPTFNIHLLGFSDCIVDDILAAKTPGVMGIDSAVPIRMALQRQWDISNTTADPGPRAHFWDDTDIDPENMKLAVKNVKTIRRWLKPW